MNELRVSLETQNAVADMGIVELTDIQRQTIPLLLDGIDLIGQSHTGTGKTAAFAIPILEKIDPDNKKPQALVLCPTRELAVQVSSEFKRLAKYKQNIRIVAVYGGEPINRQISSLKKGAQIIIGTPGRTIDHIERRHTIKTDWIHTVVLDEADEMLNMGFREDIEQILTLIPEERQTILFSATMPKPILALTKKYQKDPAFIKVESSEMTADTITQEFCETSSVHKFEALLRLLAINNPERCIVFCNMKSTVDKINEHLISQGIFAEKIHGDLKQEQRMGVLKMFNDGKVSILVATDVAARGLDIKDVDLIINYDMPDKEEYYVHRIGRSGRAGQKGRSITLITKKEKRNLDDIMRYTNKGVERISIPTNKEVHQSKIQNLLEELKASIEEENLEDYTSMVRDLAQMFSLEDLCASLLKRNFSIDAATTQNDINVNSSSQVAHSKNKFGGNPRQVNKNATRLFINVGKKDNVLAKDIASSISKECHLPKDSVGNISVMNAFSFVDINKSCTKNVLKLMHGKKIKGKRVHMELANG